MKLALAIMLGALAVGGATAGVLMLRSDGQGVTNAPAQGPYRGSEPPGINLLPAFVLPRYDGGGVVRSQTLRGRVVITTFVDSACTQACPIIVGILGRALRRLSPQEHRQFVALAISVHPRVDTPVRIRRFLTERGAIGQLDYLVASVARMKPIWKSFHVLSAAESGNADLHSADVRIFDRRGVWVSNLNVGADLSVANVVHDIRQALRG